MLLTRVRATGFRCFGKGNELDFRLQRGLNILVGENDSGKTAIVDAIRLTLGSRSEDWLRVSEADFCVPPGTDEPLNSLEIVCTLDGLTENEQARFLEWCTLDGDILRLHVCLRAKLLTVASGGKRCTWTRRSGEDGNGPSVEGALREYLASTYLRPLRDAERELSPRRRSRLSRILASLPEMSGQNKLPKDGDGEPTLRGILHQADKDIEGLDVIGQVRDRVNERYLDNLSIGSSTLEARLGIGSPQSLDQVLERLELALGPPRGQLSTVARGLGLNNALFMAAELLLLQQANQDQLPLLLIEEPEAHLHPQLQARFINMMEERSSKGEAPVQVLMSTHSPFLASGADLNALTLVADTKTYSLRSGETKLDHGDYAFLRRFLDATKANLFFARGVLVVEGDAEALLLPTIAKSIGRPLDKHGVSIVKVGHTGLFRYSRILQRQDSSEIPIPVAMVTDLDIPPMETLRLDEGKPTPRTTAKDISAKKVAQARDKLVKHEGGGVKGFVSEYWTLEFDLAASGLAAEMLAAIWRAQDRNRKKRAKTDAEIAKDAAQQVQEWGVQGLGGLEIAAEVYRPLDGGRVSKAEAAEQLAALLEEMKATEAELRQMLPPYLVGAIEHVTGGKPVDVSADKSERA